MERYTSASGMRSEIMIQDPGFKIQELKRRLRNSKLERILLVTIIFASFSFHLSAISHAELIDKVVAFVDNSAITLREFEETYEKSRAINPNIPRKEVLNTMINRMLLLTEAKKLKIEARSDEELLSEYIDLKVKAFIKISEEDLEVFYNKNISEFKGAGYDAVRDKIEEYLTEQEINRLLKRHIDELRSKAYIKVIMD